MANFTNMTAHSELPPLPTYELKPLPALLPFMSDKTLVVIGPIVLYWVFSMLFHLIDVMDLFPQYRLHTPAEILERNRVTRWEVIRDVLLQQVVQFLMGYLLASFEPDEVYGKQEYDIAIWAQRIRLAQGIVPTVLSFLGVNASGLGKSLSGNHPILAGVFLGGRYPSLNRASVSALGAAVSVPGFARWELGLASATYHLLIPAVQFLVAIIFVDTWQYFLHRGMHMNKWLYSEF